MDDAPTLVTSSAQLDGIIDSNFGFVPSINLPGGFGQPPIVVAGPGVPTNMGQAPCCCPHKWKPLYLGVATMGVLVLLSALQRGR